MNRMKKIIYLWFGFRKFEIFEIFVDIGIGIAFWLNEIEEFEVKIEQNLLKNILIHFIIWTQINK